MDVAPRAARQRAWIIRDPGRPCFVTLQDEDGDIIRAVVCASQSVLSELQARERLAREADALGLRLAGMRAGPTADLGARTLRLKTA